MHGVKAPFFIAVFFLLTAVAVLFSFSLFVPSEETFSKMVPVDKNPILWNEMNNQTNEKTILFGPLTIRTGGSISFGECIYPMKKDGNNSGNVFVPNSFVPLSPFVEVKTNNNKPCTIILEVLPEILSFASMHDMNVLVSCKNETSITYKTPKTINEEKGFVTHLAEENETCTVIADSEEGFFENDFPIVTHWNNSLNNGRGGVEVGASDQMPFIFDTNLDSPYWFRTDVAMFSDDANAVVPAYERYIGENYEGTSIPDFNIVKDSDTILRATGYPVVNKNYPWALDENSPIEKQIHENVPAFQIAHLNVIGVAPDKQSLASFLLPPHWVKNPSKKYPVFFTHFHGINGGSYPNYAVPFMKMIGNLIDQNFGYTMGILWNGGGPQRSVLDNASLLFSTAETELGADPYEIIATGGSKGGQTVLSVASNPYYNNYTVRFLMAYGPAVKFGEHVFNFINTSYNAVPSASAVVTGYKYAWQTGWTDPENGLSGEELLLKNSINTIDPEEGDSNSLYGDLFVTSLLNKGTKVILDQGTHDHFQPISLIIKYADKLKEYGVPFQFRINYRFGHNGDSQYNIWETLESAMKNILQGEEIQMEEGTFHYRRESEENYHQPVLFTPENEPIVFEGPKLTAWGLRTSFVFAGGMGDIIDLNVYKINDSQWVNNQTIVKEYQDSTLSQRVTLDSNHTIEIKANQLVIPTDGSVSQGYYVYEVGYSRDDGNSFTQIPPHYIPQVNSPAQPFLLVLSSIPPGVSGGGLIGLSEEGRAWGLSSEWVD